MAATVVKFTISPETATVEASGGAEMKGSFESSDRVDCLLSFGRGLELFGGDDGLSEFGGESG